MLVTDLTVINYMYYLQILKARINANKIFYSLVSNEKCFQMFYKNDGGIDCHQFNLEKRFWQSICQQRVGRIGGKQELRREEKSVWSLISFYSSDMSCIVSTARDEDECQVGRSQWSLDVLSCTPPHQPHSVQSNFIFRFKNLQKPSQLVQK